MTEFTFQATGVRLRNSLQNPVLRDLIDTYPEVEYALFTDVRKVDDRWVHCVLDLTSKGIYATEVSRSLLGLDALPIRQTILEHFRDGSKMLKLEIGNPEKGAPIYPAATPIHKRQRL